jgi:hypothetical protein
LEKDSSGDVVMGETKVSDLLEIQAAIPMVSNMKLSEPEAQFCITMIEKHRADYKVGSFVLLYCLVYFIRTGRKYFQ